MDKDTYPNSKIVNLAAKFVPVKLDVEKNENLKVTEKYKVNSIPAILFVDGKGRVVHQFIGYLPPDKFASEMQTALKKMKK